MLEDRRQGTLSKQNILASTSTFPNRFTKAEASLPKAPSHYYHVPYQKDRSPIKQEMLGENGNGNCERFAIKYQVYTIFDATYFDLDPDPLVPKPTIPHSKVKLPYLSTTCILSLLPTAHTLPSTPFTPDTLNPRTTFVPAPPTPLLHLPSSLLALRHRRPTNRPTPLPRIHIPSSRPIPPQTSTVQYPPSSPSAPAHPPPQDHSTYGIGAAWDRVASEFRKYGSASEGRMTVEVMWYEQGVAAERILFPLRISDVVAKLKE